MEGSRRAEFMTLLLLLHQHNSVRKKAIDSPRVAEHRSRASEVTPVPLL